MNHAGRPERKDILGLLAASAVLLVGGLDYLTGNELAWFAFYLVPIGWAAWRLGLRAAVAIAGLSTLAWMLAAGVGVPSDPRPALGASLAGATLTLNCRT